MGILILMLAPLLLAVILAWGSLNASAARHRAEGHPSKPVADRRRGPAKHA
ncbi:hypothetical protein GCM10010495_38660 [Kitasatospora herbaricolor]|uniref:hypothetical protein n=1 Tax=Kitasatospora herbaricolor TaxID=68217 RepID=UPI00174AFCD5|nr:hypothetical protein [Kitasatospora herbaricolor]MDQ0306843.1 hypothetical protein [Kitasatospora herbaricolor]GGV19696.1 hypothetical protein GCM10010495_38660 [Kitasatospora herbaricolor]